MLPLTIVLLAAFTFRQKRAKPAFWSTPRERQSKNLFLLDKGQPLISAFHSSVLPLPSSSPSLRSVLICYCEPANVERPSTTGLDFLQQSQLESILTNALYQMQVVMDPEFLHEIKNDILQDFFVRTCADNVHVAPSTIPNAGNGLFASRDIQAGTIVTLYPVHALGVNINGTSFTVTLDESDQEYFQSSGNDDDDGFTKKSNYLLYLLENRPFSKTNLLQKLSAHPFVDVNPARSAQSSWLCQFINDGAIIHENTEQGVLQYFETSGAERNCDICPFGPSPLNAAVTSKLIRKGDELFASYGYSYWVSALVGDDRGKWTEKTESIRLKEQSVLHELMNVVGRVQDHYAQEAMQLHCVFDSID